jgi:hypothetical protein
MKKNYLNYEFIFYQNIPKINKNNHPKPYYQKNKNLPSKENITNCPHVRAASHSQVATTRIVGTHQLSETGW